MPEHLAGKGDDRGFRLGTPCQFDHTIHRDGNRFWITCGDDVLDDATFAGSALSYREEPQRWANVVMLRHEAACWKALAAELLEEYIDACHQGSGNEPLSFPQWHNFMSTYEYADKLIPRAKAALTDDPSDPQKRALVPAPLSDRDGAAASSPDPQKAEM